MPAVALLVAATALGTGGAGLMSTTPAGADPMSDCTTTTGVVVVVDFTAFHNGNSWDGTIVQGCAASATTGYGALTAAGFTPSGDQHDGPAFVCRIDDDPAPSQVDCVDTPPADASWSYWHGDPRTNTWTYATTGAMDYCPPPGTVDAWVFSGSTGAGPGGRPSQPPDAYAATAPGPAAGDPCASPSGGSGPGVIVGPAGGATGGTPGVPATATPTSTTTTTTPGAPASPTTTTTTRPAAVAGGSGATAAPSAGGGGSSTGTPAGPRVLDATSAFARRPARSGSPWPLVLGLVAALVVVAGGGVGARRRRRRLGDG